MTNSPVAPLITTVYSPNRVQEKEKLSLRAGTKPRTTSSHAIKSQPRTIRISCRQYVTLRSAVRTHVHPFALARLTTTCQCTTRCLNCQFLQKKKRLSYETVNPGSHQNMPFLLSARHCTLKLRDTCVPPPSNLLALLAMLACHFHAAPELES